MKYLLSLFLSLQFSFLALAHHSPQRIQFENLNVADCLPENSVKCMIQDHLGYIWLGTQNGLVRYDGTKMKNFQYEPGNPYSMRNASQIMGLHEDRNGDIWIASENLFRFERASQRFIEYPRKSPEKIENTDVKLFMHEDKQGNIWTVTSRNSYSTNLLDRYNPKTDTWTYFRHNLTENNSLSGNRIYISAINNISVYSFLEDKTGEIWVTSITENQFLEKKVELRTKQLEDSLETLKTTQTQLIQKEKLASLGELTAGIAHEIQNPLNFVNNFSELSVDLVKELKEEVEKHEMDKELIIDLATDLSQNQEEINLHGKRASNIVKGMLEHSKASTGKKELTDINALAEEYLRLAYYGMQAKEKEGAPLPFKAEFGTDFSKDLPKIEIIPQDIGRVLLNLLNNAFYVVSVARTGSPWVQLSTKKLSDSVEIRVKDNGTGIPENIKAKIFQPFFTTKPTGGGTGLGPSLTYNIITKGYGGAIECESVEGEGATFIVKLPFILNKS